MNKNNNKMDLLGNAPVPQALMALGIPIMIGMLINALYNLVDAYFIGGLGESQMGAISIAFPLGQVVVGLGLMFGNGAASYLSRLLGRGDREAASKVASTALYSSVCIGAVIIIGTAIFLKPILTMLGATDTIMPCKQMILPCNHIFWFNFCNLSLPKVWKNFCSGNIILSSPCVIPDSFLFIFYIDFIKTCESHIQFCIML